MSICPCGETATHKCSLCGRPLCAGHWVAVLEFADHGGHKQGKACFPQCQAPWWQNQTREWKPA